MQVAGIIAEYNPLHEGHLYLMKTVRERLGEDCGIICVMSGNFVQRGEFAILGKHARAEAAVRSGADLVLELPLPWAAAPAERFADGGIQILAGTGVVDTLAFGSECGDSAALMRLAAVLRSALFSQRLREELGRGDSFAAARQRAVAGVLTQEEAALLSAPNNILGVEYGKALLARGVSMEVLTVPRRGAAHDALPAEGEAPSASALRRWLITEERTRALAALPEAMEQIFLREEAAGRAPVRAGNCERAILARLRMMTEEDFAGLDTGREGLYHRLYEAVRKAASLEEVLEAAKTKRYSMARLRRMVLWGYLGLTPNGVPEEVPYLRVLAANEIGCRLLGRMRHTARVPVLTKPADVRRLSEEAQRLFSLEARATDLYTLAYPMLSAAEGGGEWRQGPVILKGSPRGAG